MRIARAGTVALVCTGLAAGAHVAGGGRPSLAGLAVVLLGTGVVAHALAGHRLATTQLTGLLLMGQVVTHAVSAPAPPGSDAAMLAAHVLGTGASVLLLRRGEDALWTLAERIALRATAVAQLVSVPPAAPAPVPVAAPRSDHAVLLASEIARRGPPAGR